MCFCIRNNLNLKTNKIIKYLYKFLVFKKRHTTQWDYEKINFNGFFNPLSKIGIRNEQKIFSRSIFITFEISITRFHVIIPLLNNCFSCNGIPFDFLFLDIFVWKKIKLILKLNFVQFFVFQFKAIKTELKI